MISRITITLALLCFSIQTAEAATFGRTAGKFGVSQIGTTQYSIPIWTPPGPKGIQPHLSLSYDSSADIGPLGIGWFIAGLGAVTRCNKTYAQDTTPAAVALVVSDGYCLNGKRLRLTSGTYGTDSSTYQTEIADFSNITAHSAAGNGPAYFTVQGRDGNLYQYGYTDANGNGAGSQVLATGTSTASVWLLSKVIDRAGNNFVINYTTLIGTAVPSEILWTPTSATASTYTYTMLFNYGANVPPSSITQYVAGTTILNSELLTSIAISASGTVIKDYFLGYQASPTTGRDELITVQECADTAKSNCLLATNIAYQNGSIGVSTTATTALSSSGALLRARYDLNGDGIPDLIYNPTGTGPWYVAFGSVTGYGTPINTGITGAALFGNLTGGNKDGILAAVSGTWWYYTWNGSSFTGTSTGLAVDSTSYGFQLADINGDGLPDLIDLNIGPEGSKFNATINTHLNTSTGSTARFSSTVVGTPVAGPIDGAQLATPDTQYGKLRHYDFDGDGRDDLVLITESGNSPNFTMNTYTLVSTSTGFTKTLIQSVAGSDYEPVFFTNWNDDACTDFVANSSIYISACNGAAGASLVLGANVIGAMDWDGDGRTDLIVSNGSTIGVFLSSGTGYGSMLSTTIPYSSTCQYVTMDANGDGLDDLGCWSQTSPSPLTYYLHNGAGQPPDLAIDFWDGYTVKYTAAYIALSQATSANYTEGTSQVFPQRDYDGPMYVTQYALIPNGIGSTYTLHYDYTGAVMNLQGRGFQGFTTVNVLSDQVHFNDTKTYSTGTLSAGLVVPTAGMLLGETVITTGGTNVANALYTLAIDTLDATSNNERYFPYIASSTANTYEIQPGGSYNGELITTTAMNYGTPDIYGNFSSVEKTVTDEDSGSPYYGEQWTTTTATTISASPSTWCNSLPSERDVTKTAPGVPAITRHRSFTPDYSFCRETQKVVESGNLTYQVTTGYAFDAFGNINSQTVTGIGMAARTTGMNWGTTGQFPSTMTNALNQTTLTSFDPNSGKLLSVQDPNGIVTSWQYDPFERKDKEIRADGTSTTWAYNNCATAGCVNSNNEMTIVQTNVNTDGSTLNIQNTYQDQFDRVLVTSKQMLNGAYDRNEVQYSGLGTVQQQAAPCTFVSCVYYWTTYSYDNLKRLTQTQRPISATNGTLQSTTIQYSGRTTTVTDPQGKVTTNIAQVTGSVGRTKDDNNYYVNFNRDAWGSVLSVTDSLSNTLRTMTYAYGVKALPTKLIDMDLGTRLYTPDALGEITAYSDSKGQDFSAIYDALSRMTSRTESTDLTSTWTWGTTAATHNIGKLASDQSVSSGGTYIESYTYDSIGRLSDETITLPTDGTPAFDYAYSTKTGLLSTLTYPPSFPTTYRLTAGYTYQYGILQQIFDSLVPTTIWWQANAMNPRGQITEETTEDLSGDPQIVSNRTYDAVTGWLGSTQTGPGGGATLQNEAYLYDEIGNVTQRQNNNLGLTENFYYDNLYRLDHSMLGSSINLQMGYDAMGDITSRSDVAGGATWTYDPVRKHAVTQAGSSSYTYAYDANGNVTSRNGSLIGWTSYNYPSGVATATESATFDYGPNRQRWRMIYSGPSGGETTFYATPKFEKVYVGGGGEYRSYIYAGNRPVVVVMRNTASQIKVRSLLVDHQGSVASIITDSTGASLVGESFTAYGNRREASTWSGAPTTGELTTMNGVTREGYTFQTVLGSMGLNHMNGRIEDAVTGRFLSADPHGTIRGNTQSWNRYSYVNNNPLSYVDPTGFRGCMLDYCTFQPAWAIHNIGGLFGWLAEDWDGTDSNSFYQGTDSGLIVTYDYGDGSGGGGGGGSGDTDPPASTPDTGQASTNDPEAQSNSFNDPNAFNPQVAAAQYLQAQSGGATLTIPGLDFVPDPTIGMADFSAATSTLSMSAMSQQPNNFVTAAGALVGTTAVIGGGAGAIYAFGELATVTTTGIGVDFGGTIILSVGALSDVGGMAAVGSTVGAAGGVVLLPAFGVGWFIGSRLNPYVQPIISSWYGY